jgi:nitrogen fixation/metabolism regulation signal transduction histidine kinase
MRTRILFFVATLILLTLFGSITSVVQITGVSRSLTEINDVSIPLNRLLTQLLTDADVFRKEMQKSVGSVHWNDPRWSPRLPGQWLNDVILSEFDRAEKLLGTASAIKFEKGDWIQKQRAEFQALEKESHLIFDLLQKRKLNEASEIYPAWIRRLEDWFSRMQYGVKEFDRSLQQQFESSQTLVARLRTGLELILLVVFSLSLLILWLGERALRPLNELTNLVRNITSRGLTREDKVILESFPVSRSDEVSQLSIEFHRMATQLLEREKEVENQKTRLQDQYALLQEVSKLSDTILKSIRFPLLVADLSGKVTRANPRAIQLFSTEKESLLGRQLEEILPNLSTEGRLEHRIILGRTYGGQAFPLLDRGKREGLIVVLEDLTEELRIEGRLREAEHLAAIGRLSAQVAHEVRNPLHAMGLEAEMAFEQAQKLKDSGLKSTIQSIQEGIERLELITQNYLKLSRMSGGEVERLDLHEVIVQSLAQHEVSLNQRGFQVNWESHPEGHYWVKGDRTLLHQAFGNLIQNSVQACEGEREPRLEIRLTKLESGRIAFLFEDSGPGFSAEVKGKLFTPFLTTKANGTGLGLSFIRKVMEDHGGDVNVQDPRILSGASFQLIFPEALESEPSLSSPAHKIVSKGAKNDLPAV